jgi:hypothetical protein
MEGWKTEGRVRVKRGQRLGDVANFLTFELCSSQLVRIALLLVSKDVEL